jgi:hypothetical protein
MGELDADEIRRMSTPLWERAKAAIDAGDPDRAKAEIDRAVEAWMSLRDYSINWIASLLSFIGTELGEEAVEAALRRTGEEFVRPRRTGGMPWEELPAAVRAKVIARAMLANGGTVEVTEDDEKITLSFRCGSGGRLVDEGRYDDGGYLVLRERAGRTFMRDELWVYCAHCSVNNEIQPLEWGGVPTSVEHPPHRPGEPCVHHVYKDARALPPEAYRRLGLEPPAPDAPA